MFGERFHLLRYILEIRYLSCGYCYDLVKILFLNLSLCLFCIKRCLKNESFEYTVVKLGYRPFGKMTYRFIPFSLDE